uniref:ATP synthase F0 subunit 8 n=1 Tax=Archichauliodes diversus TaxID=1763602 RepID=UPI0028D557AD|nr:ATP synthase F0 subunit 8 [Archichauliodes diversus]WMQ76528.1 ATP synthase F0 subunit 8 [Archichauliodes diversus]
MPQMSPLNWLILFMFFSIIFIIFNSMNYFLTNYLIPLSNKNIISNKSFNWKW